MILLDTHILLWWIGDRKRLTSKAKSAIAKAATKQELAVSAISFWEIALLLHKRRLVVSMDAHQWLDQIEAYQGLHVVPIDALIARSSVILPGAFHNDPADRMIIATARNLGIPLVTADKKIREYPHVQSIW